jgi:hypothetical protein
MFVFNVWLFSLFVSDFIMFQIVFILFVELVIWLLYLDLLTSVITVASILQYYL